MMIGDNIVRRTEGEGKGRGAVYSFAADEATENMIATAAEFHSCKPEAIVAQAIAIYVAAFHESLRLAVAARDDGGPSH